jgi:hypothetical protein
MFVRCSHPFRISPIDANVLAEMSPGQRSSVMAVKAIAIVKFQKCVFVTLDPEAVHQAGNLSR